MRWAVSNVVALYYSERSSEGLTAIAVAFNNADSPFPDAERVVTRGRLDPTGAPADVLLVFTDNDVELTIECRLTDIDLTGELLETLSLLLTACPFLKLVAGGSGSGRELEGV